MTKPKTPKTPNPDQAAGTAKRKTPAKKPAAASTPELVKELPKSRKPRQGVGQPEAAPVKRPRKVAAAPAVPAPVLPPVPAGKRVGYVRVSTAEQNTVRQLDGVPLDKTFTDRASGKDATRPELAKLLDFVRDGDTVLVHSLDRLGRNLDDLRRLVAELNAGGVVVQFVKEGWTFTPEGMRGPEAAASRLLFSIMGAFCEFERGLMLERQREGIAHAKLAGKYKGRAVALSDDLAGQLRARAAAGESIPALAEEFGVSRATAYRVARAG